MVFALRFARFAGPRCALFLLFVSMFAVSARADALGWTGRDDRVIPFTFQPPAEPFIVVKGKLNGVPLQFMVDTGTSFALVLYPWAVDQAKVPLAGDKVSVGGKSVSVLGQSDLTLMGAAGSQDIRFAVGNSVEMEESSFLKEYPSGRIAGLIGAEAVIPFLTRIDFDRRTLTFSPGRRAPLVRSGETGRTLLLQRVAGAETPYLNAAVKGRDGKETSVLFLIDTGNPRTSLPGGVRALLPADIPMVSSVYSSVVSGDKAARDGLLPELDLDGLTTPRVRFSLVPGAEEAALGMDVLSRFDLTIDGPNSLITLEPRPGYTIRSEGVLGVSVLEHEGGIYIDGIDHSRFPRGVDISEGDQIVSVDGRDLRGLSEWAATRLLNGYAGEDATLVLARSSAGGRTIRLQLPRLDPFASR